MKVAKSDADYTPIASKEMPALIVNGMTSQPSETKITRQDMKPDELRYTTTTGDYGRYLSLMMPKMTPATSPVASAINDGGSKCTGNDSLSFSTFSSVVPGWRRFTRQQAQIGMYRSSGLN